MTTFGETAPGLMLADSEQPIGGQTLESRLRTAAAWAGSAPALLDDSGVRATHHDLRRMRDGGRLRLREAGVGPHDRVALIMEDDWRLAVALLATACACAVTVLDPRLPDRELAIRLAALRPKAVVADAESTPRMRVLVTEDIGVLLWNVEALDAAAGDAAGDLPALEDPAILLFTSGTTARPKLVPLTQRNVAAGAASIAVTMRLGPADRALNVMTLYHGHGVWPGTFAPLVSGGSTVCSRLKNAAELHAVAESAAPTWYCAAPVMHHTILAMSRSDPRIRQTLRLRAIRSGSSALPPRLLSQLEDFFSVPVVESYALSEAPGQIASNPLEGIRKASTVGTPQHCKIAVLTAAGDVTDAPGSAGEVLVRGAAVMPGYLGVPDSEQPFLDGWLRTGDQGTLDEDGYLALGGRLVDVISRGAEKFAPGEVEAVLAEHPAVREVAVFGRPHATLGQEAAAAVVRHEGHSVTERELIAFAAQRLAAFMVPVQIYFLAELPRLQTGKLLRRTLQEMAARSRARTGHRMAPPL
jgi:oxalate---CoA ligase